MINHLTILPSSTVNKYNSYKPLTELPEEYGDAQQNNLDAEVSKDIEEYINPDDIQIAACINNIEDDYDTNGIGFYIYNDNIDNERNYFIHHDYFVNGTIAGSVFHNNLLFVHVFDSADVLIYDIHMEYTTAPNGVLRNNSNVKDISILGNILYVLCGKEIVEWDLNSFKITKKYDIEFEGDGFVMNENTFYVYQKDTILVYLVNEMESNTAILKNTLYVDNEIVKLLVVNSDLCVFDVNAGLVVFDKNGKVKSKINLQGNGLEFVDVAYNENTHGLYVLFSNVVKVYKITEEGIEHTEIVEIAIKEHADKEKDVMLKKTKKSKNKATAIVAHKDKVFVGTETNKIIRIKVK